jgi:hypothetical protein
MNTQNSYFVTNEFDLPTKPGSVVAWTGRHAFAGHPATHRTGAAVLLYADTWSYGGMYFTPERLFDLADADAIEVLA